MASSNYGIKQVGIVGGGQMGGGVAEVMAKAGLQTVIKEVNAELAEKSNSETIKKGVRSLAWVVLVGWAIYPIGYMAGTEGWYSGIFGGLDGSMDVLYNVGDAINKIGFGLVVYNLAVQSK